MNGKHAAASCGIAVVVPCLQNGYGRVAGRRRGEMFVVVVRGCSYESANGGWEVEVGNNAAALRT